MRHLEKYTTYKTLFLHLRSRLKSEVEGQVFSLHFNKKTTKASLIDLMKSETIMSWYVIIKVKVLCPRSGSHREVKQNDN